MADSPPRPSDDEFGRFMDELLKAAAGQGGELSADSKPVAGQSQDLIEAGLLDAMNAQLAYVRTLNPRGLEGVKAGNLLVGMRVALLCIRSGAYDQRALIKLIKQASKEIIDLL